MDPYAPQPVARVPVRPAGSASGNQPRLLADQERHFVDALQQLREQGYPENHPTVVGLLKLWSERSLVNSSAVSMETARLADTLQHAGTSAGERVAATVPPPALPPNDATVHLTPTGAAATLPDATGAPTVLVGGGVHVLSQLTPDQALQLQAQALAYKHLARGVPVPPPVQLAAAGAPAHVPPLVLGPAGAPVPADQAGLQQASLVRAVAHAAVANARDATGDLPPLEQRAQPLRRQLLPRTLPHGIALQQILQAREARIRAMVAHRIDELSGLPANLPHALRVRALIELKALRLLGMQRRLREEVVRGMRKGTTTEVRHAKKRLRRHEMYEERLSEQLERRQQQEKEHRERARKMKHREALNRLIQHGKDFKDHHKNAAARAVRIGDFVAKWHRNTLAEEKRTRERAEQARRRALKANDFAAWEEMVLSERNERAVYLVTQTNKFLDDLIGRVLVTKEDAVAEAQAASGLPVAPPTSLTVGTKPDELPRNRRFYQIAHSVMETVTTQPTMLKNGTLKEYQLKGLQWMVSLYNNSLNGILADEMGLGKTIQTIALLAYLMEVKGNKGPFLIVVPLSTINNWSLEFEKWAPDIVKVVYQGEQKTRRSLLQSAQFNVLITTYEMIINDRPYLAKLKWMHLIVDEGHRLKNDNSKLTTTLSQYYNAQHRMLLTGTPLQNSLPELWSLLNFLLPKVFNSVTTFDKWFNAPFESYKLVSRDDMALKEEEQLYLISRLHSALEPFMLRRLKKDVAAELPDKVEKVIKCRMSALQELMYRECMANKADEPDATNHFRFNRNGTLAELRKICNHPFLIPAVHERLNIDDTDLLVRTSGKFDLLDRIIPKLLAVRQQVVLFFQMTTCMDYVAQYFDARGYRYLRLDGHASGEERTTAMHLFSAPNPDYYLFIATTRAGGQGINLQTAATVIHFESDWNPHADQQAQARTHRLGQQQEVRIFRFIVDHSIEEIIVERAQHKLNIDEKVIQAGKFDLKTTTTERDLILKAIMQREREGEGEEGEESPEYDDDELNQMLARTDEDLVVFARIDRERRERQQAAWRAAGHRGDAPRLLTIDEIPRAWLEKAVPREVLQQQEFESHGRGQRKQARAVSYREPTDAQFLRALESADPQEYLERVQRQQEKGRRKREGGGGSDEVEPDDDDDDGDEDDDSGARTPRSSKRQRTGTSGGGRAGRAATAAPSLAQTCGSLLDVIESVRDASGRVRCDLFRELPSRVDYPDYYAVITRPLALATLRSRLGQGKYRTLDAFVAEVRTLFGNARTYNEEGSAVYDDADALEAAFDRALERVQAGEVAVPASGSASSAGGARGRRRGPERTSTPGTPTSDAPSLKLSIKLSGVAAPASAARRGGGNGRSRRRAAESESESDSSSSSSDDDDNDDDDDDDDEGDEGGSSEAQGYSPAMVAPRPVRVRRTPMAVTMAAEDEDEDEEEEEDDDEEDDDDDDDDE